MMFSKKAPLQVQTRQRGSSCCIQRINHEQVWLGTHTKRVIEYYTTHNTERTGVTTVKIYGCSSLEDVLTGRSGVRSFAT